MTSRSELIDRIVSNVLQELTTSGNLPHGGQRRQSPADVTEIPQANRESILVLTQKVITESELQKAGAAGRTVRFAAGAVFTPSGREFIKRQHVRIASSSPGDPTTIEGGVLLFAENDGGLSAVAAAQAVGWTTRELTNDREIAFAAADVCREASVVCSCREPSVVACLLNRDSTIRAAVCVPSTDVAELSAAMSPDVVCIGRTGWSVADLRRLMSSLAGQPTRAPEGWSEIAQGGPR